MRVFSSFDKSAAAKISTSEKLATPGAVGKKERAAAAKAKSAAAKKLERPSAEEIREKVAINSKNKNPKSVNKHAGPAKAVAPEAPIAPEAPVAAAAPSIPSIPDSPSVSNSSPKKELSDVAEKVPLILPDKQGAEEKEVLPPKTEILGDVRDNNPNSPETVFKLKEVLKSGGINFNEREKNVLSQIINQ